VDEPVRPGPDVRTARVEQVRDAIDSGIYNVKAERIADKIIDASLLDKTS
jgi:flagellar biosynthesis anti-sigma factor FlgM